MIGQQWPGRAGVTLLACLCVGVPSVVPLLDARETETAAHAESSHDPGRCLRLHDHAACVQIVKTTPLPVTPWQAREASSSSDARAVVPRRVPPDRPAASSHVPRAPPGPTA